MYNYLKGGVIINDINERLTYLRKKVLKLTQDDFSKKLNVTKASISRYESGERTITERTISDICREFNINRKWLVDGLGDMFITGEDFESLILNITNEDKDLITSYLTLPQYVKTSLKNSISIFMDHYYTNVTKDRSNNTISNLLAAYNAEQVDTDSSDYKDDIQMIKSLAKSSQQLKLPSD